MVKKNKNLDATISAHIEREKELERKVEVGKKLEYQWKKEMAILESKITEDKETLIAKDLEIVSVLIKSQKK